MENACPELVFPGRCSTVYPVKTVPLRGRQKEYHGGTDVGLFKTFSGVGLQ